MGPKKAPPSNKTKPRKKRSGSSNHSDNRSFKSTSTNSSITKNDQLNKRKKRKPRKKHSPKLSQEEADKKFFEDLASIFLLPLGTLSDLDATEEDDDLEHNTLQIDGGNDDRVILSIAMDASPSPPRSDNTALASWAKVTKRGKHTNQSPEQLELKRRIKEEQDRVNAYRKEHALDFEKQDTRTRILLQQTPLHIKVMLLEKFEEMNTKNTSIFGGGGSGDKNKYQQWLNDVLKLPYGKSRSLPVTLSQGSEKIRAYLDSTRQTLNDAIWGHDHAKEEIIDYIAKIISNPEGKGSVLALSGPKGTGKTRLVKQGVAKALGRPFHVINLAGASDVHTLVGHSSTYVGAKPGKLAEILMMSRCDNPVIYLDEIDKVESKSEKGMEVFRLLTHLLDPEQNYEFFDEYFDNVPIDLSKVLFVASMNNPNDIESILRDRLKIVHIHALTRKEKLKIAYDYILPELCDNLAMDVNHLVIPESVMCTIIDFGSGSSSGGVGGEEDGCRQTKRNLETILQRLNTMRITATGVYQDKDVKDPFTLTHDIVNDFLKHSTAAMVQDVGLSMMYT